MSSTETIQSFADLGLPSELAVEVSELGYETPTPVQARSIPVLLSGRDLIGQAQTGTGKTAAFALPLLGRLDRGSASTQILVLAPTRELAIQVAEAFRSYARCYKKFQVLPIYGGQSMGIQLKHLSRSPQVVVGTPGRVMDHLRRKSLKLSSIKAIVIDEADEMLSMGFVEDIKWILEQAPAEKQVALFSATMPSPIRAIAQRYLRDPEEIVVKQIASEAPLISQSHWVVYSEHKLEALTRILEASETDGVLIFMRTKTATLELSEKLEARGYRSGALNGDMSQEARERTVQRFKEGRLDVLIATDVAARGLHIDRISHVINYDAPFDLQTYTHRIGRTGRAGRTGTAILFITPREMGLLRSLERGTSQPIPRFQMPTREDLGQKRIELLVEKVKASARAGETKEYGRVVEQLCSEADLSVQELAAVLCALLHVDTPLFSVGPDPVSAPRESSSQGNRSRQQNRPPKSRWRRGSGQSSSRPHRASSGSDSGSRRGGRSRKGRNSRPVSGRH